ncbi:hypothetical protein [Caproicibacter sp.]|uniref:hypothetical protein n=1 Tax=Caproicibacter sp. TaxID=2814884 RepID=UPI003989F9B9
MLGKLSNRTLSTRIMVWLCAGLIFFLLGAAVNANWSGMVQGNQDFARLIAYARALYYRIRVVVWAIISFFLIWHGCDVLYRLLSVCQSFQEEQQR